VSDGIIYIIISVYTHNEMETIKVMNLITLQPSKNKSLLLFLFLQCCHCLKRYQEFFKCFNKKTRVIFYFTCCQGVITGTFFYKTTHCRPTLD
jgi:hypothetical protein